MSGFMGVLKVNSTLEWLESTLALGISQAKKTVLALGIVIRHVWNHRRITPGVLHGSLFWLVGPKSDTVAILF